MKIAIIGANSLLASYIIEIFSQNFDNELLLWGKDVSAFHDTKATIIFSYFNYPEVSINSVDLLNCDVVIYCAATGVQANTRADNLLTYEINAFLPIRIISYLSSNNFSGKWISFGSYFEIGNNESNTFLSERQVVLSPFAIPNHYCASKRLLTRAINDEIFKGNIFHFILPTIYGKRENSSRLIPYIINALKNNSEVYLSAGQQIRQYLHCNDITRLIEMVANGNYAAGIYNVSDEEQIKVASLVQNIFTLFGKDASSTLGTATTRDESMLVLLLSPSKLAKEIPEWKPLISIQEGIREYL